MMKKIFLILLVLTGLVSGGDVWAQTVEVNGDISNVIVYRGQALVTRTIEVDLPEGTGELIVGNLPEQIVPESLYSQADGKITILSVRYREKAIKEDTRAEVKALDEQIEEINKQIYRLKRDRDSDVIVYRKYKDLWDLNIDGANVNLNKGVLEFEPIEKLTGYLESKAIELHGKIVQSEQQQKELQKELDLLNRKRKDLEAGRSQTMREAAVYLNKPDNKPARIELSYLVNGANWSPQYNLRAMPENSMTVIEYNAVVHQASGESWENTTLKLSTAQPSLVASPPELEPMEISLTASMTKFARRMRQTQDRTGGMMPGIMPGMMPGMMPGLGEPNKMEDEQFSYTDQSESFGRLLKSRGANIGKGVKAQQELNSIALENQMYELYADKLTLQRMHSQAKRIKRTEGVSVMYTVPGKLTLPSRSDQQLLTIATIKAKAEFVLTAMPLLTDYVYLQGEILNDSETILLPGPASMYRNGEFVGKGQMNLVTVGQKFTSGFGIDSQVQITREFKDKKTETLWGNRIDEQRYSIEISSYKNSPVKLRLMERLPFTENPNIEIKLTEPSHKLSTDSEYIRTLKDKGILRWDLTLKGNSVGEKATVVEYGYTMKYDNDMHIETVAKN